MQPRLRADQPAARKFTKCWKYGLPVFKTKTRQAQTVAPRATQAQCRMQVPGNDGVG